MSRQQHKKPHSLISRKDNDEKEKASLISSLAKKKQKLLQISALVEMLKMDLDIIKREYDIRIGKLYAKDDQLDLEIFRYNRIKSMLAQGLSYDEAVKKVNESYEEEINIFSMRFEEIAKEEEELAQRKVVEQYQVQDIKTLWKKLLFQLHPDLTADEQEKKKREDIMRKINIAYKQNDYEALKNVENQHYVEDPHTSSVETLTQSLVSIENSIIARENEYQQLRNSEWFMWKKKSEYAKKRNIDLFKDLEEKLLNDIARKITLVHSYREEFDVKGFY